MKLKYILKRIKNMSYKNMLVVVDEISKKTGKNKILILIDVIYCGFKYQAGYMDYKLFEMYKMNKKERATIVTRGVNNTFIKYFNDSKFNDYFSIKPMFNEKFNSYLKRDWLLIDNNFTDFEKFVSKHPTFIAKPVDGMCGKNIEKITVNNAKDTFNYLIDHNLLLVEEVLEQNDVLKALHPHSINTVRIITIRNKDLVSILAIYFRIGNGKVVDNFNSGGMVVPVNKETGIVEFPALDKAGNLYERHPLTDVSIKGFKIPMFEECKKLVMESALIISETNMVGWDVALTKSGPALVEGNEFPGHDIYQLPPHRNGNIGLLPDFIEALNKINIEYKKMK